MREKIVWAATPEAKAKLAAGKKPPAGKKWNCPDMKRAREQAEKAVEEITQETSAVGGENNIDRGEEK
jgi:hypothetical protein